MGWLFGKKNVSTMVPPPAPRPFDEKALRFPSGIISQRRVIESDNLKAIAGFDKPIAFPEDDEEKLSAPQVQQRPVPPVATTKSMMPSVQPVPEAAPESMAPCYVKVSVYQRLLGEIEMMKADLNQLQHTQKTLETSEYNEEHNFEKLRKAVKHLHDRLLRVDTVLFKA